MFSSSEEKKIPMPVTQHMSYYRDQIPSLHMQFYKYFFLAYMYCNYLGLPPCFSDLDIEI